MRSPQGSLFVRLATALYRLAARALPGEFRHDYGEELLSCFSYIAREARERSRWAVVEVTVRSIIDLITRAPAQHLAAVRIGALGPGGGWAGTWQDVRHAFRRLKRRPSFTFASVLTLALGIAAATSVFTLVHAVVLNPLPYPQPDRIVQIDHGAASLGIDHGLGITFGFYRFYAAHLHSAASLAMYSQGDVTLNGAGDPVRLESAATTRSLVDVLHLRPSIGRWFSAEDAQPGAPRVVVLSSHLWRERFASDAKVVGRSIDLDGEPYTAIGVMPAGFAFPSAHTDLWLPKVVPATGIGGWNQKAVARLAPGARLEDLSREIRGLFPRLRAAADDPAAVASYLDDARIFPRVVPLKDEIVGQVRATLWVLLGTVGIVLLIAMANVANLFLVRAEDAERETAVRTALGAGRGRVLRSFLAESLFLASAAGILGIALAAVAVRILRLRAPVSIPRLSEVHLDPTVVAVAVGATLVTALVLGASATVQQRRDLIQALREGSRHTGSAHGALGGRNVLVVAQVALALVLLIGSGLLFRSLGALRSVDLGFQQRRALVFDVGLPASRYADRKAQQQFHDRALDKLRALPGVTSVAALGQCLPLSGHMCWGDTLEAEGHPTPDGQVPPVTGVRVASAGYFRALEIPLRGRAFRAGDQAAGASAVILSRAAAQAYFPGDDALGRRIRFGAQAPWHTIVGIAGNVHGRVESDDFERLIYLPILPVSEEGPAPDTLTYIVVTSLPPTSLAKVVRRAMAQLDPALPLADMRTLQGVVDAAMAPTAFALTLIALAATIALLLGAVGVYAVVAYAVSRRTAEIGIRLALGARASDVLSLVFAQGGRLVLVGVGLGLVAAGLLTRLMSSMLFGVAPFDLPSYAAVTGLMLAVAALALFLPAFRASRVAPSQALRSE